MKSDTDHIYKREAEYKDYTVDLDKVYYRRIIKDVEVYASGAAEKKLLDIACFDGTLTMQFSGGWDLYGMEGNLDACRNAQGKGVKAVLHDLERPFPFENGFFDCVIAAEIIEHLYDTDAFLREIHRVLKPGGVLVVSIPNMACLTNRITMLFGKYPRYAEYRGGGPGHIRVYTGPVIKSQIEENGFKVLKYAGCNFPLPMHNPKIPAWIKNIAVRLGDFFPTIAGQVIVTSRKF